MRDRRPLAASGARLPSEAASRIVAVVALIGVTVAAYTRFLSTGFAATDSLPLIETSRLHGLADIALQFTRPVMAGTSFATGEVVYRPFVAVMFGVDYALYGLNATGFHATNLALHVIAVLGVWFLLLRLGLRTWSALAGATLFALHPLVVASVPVIARRDSVVPVAMFVWGAALLISAEQARSPRRAWLLVGSLVLVAIALVSKESAFAALVMLPMLLTASILARGGDLRAAIRRANLVVPFIVLAVAVFVVRFLVLRGLGGGADNSELLVVDWDKYSQTLGAFTRELAWAFAWVASSTRELWPRLAGACLLGLTLTIPWLPRRHAIIAAAGVVWMAGFALFCIALKIATIAWLAYFSLVGLAMLFGAGVEGAVVRLRGPASGSFRIARRAVPGALLGALAAYSATALYASALVRNYDQWQIAGDVTQRFTQALSACVAQAPAATQVRLNALPSSFEDGRFETNLMGVTLLEDWTVNSALRLMFPGRDLAVHVSSWGTLRAGADTLHFACSVPNPSAIELTTTY